MFLQRFFRGSQHDKTAVPELESSSSPYCELQILEQHRDIVRHLILANEFTLISASDDSTVCIWDVNTGCLMRTLKGHEQQITNILCVPKQDDADHLLLFTVSTDKVVCVWDVETGQCLHQTKTPTAIRCVTHLSKSTICTAGERIHVWDVERGERIPAQVAIGERTDDIRHVIVSNPIVVCAVSNQLMIYRLHFNHATRSYILSCEHEVKEEDGHQEDISCLSKISDKLFATASLDGNIKLWSVTCGVPVTNLHHPVYDAHHSFKCSVPCMIAWYRFLFVAVGSGFHVYDVESRSKVSGRDNCHHSKILDMTFLENAGILVTSAQDGSIRLWGQSPPANEPPPLGVTHQSPAVISTKFLGKDRQVHLLGECLAHSNGVMRLVAIPTGFSSCGMDHLVMMWKHEHLQSEYRTHIIREYVCALD